MTFVILRAWYCKMLMSVPRIVSEARRGSATAPSITICALDRRFVERDRKTFDMTQSAARRPPHSMSWIEQVTLTCPNITEHKPNPRPAPPGTTVVRGWTAPGLPPHICCRSGRGSTICITSAAGKAWLVPRLQSSAHTNIDSAGLVVYTENLHHQFIITIFS